MPEPVSTSVTIEPARLIATPEELARLIEAWHAEPVIGIDTEAASFHRFRDRVYLVQLSTVTETVVVDPLGTGGIEALGPWLGSDDTEFVFHDADYDLRLMHREAGLRVRRLFDTRIAAQFLNLPGIGLGAILEDRFGVKTNKRFQRADWSARPLSPEMLEYAATDTRFLAALRDAFRSELTQMGRLAWVEEEARLLIGVEWPPSEPPEQTFLKIKGARDLDRRGLAVLRELHVWRNEVAGRLDRALFRVLGNEPMLQMAALRPRSTADLGRIRGVGGDNLARRGDELLEAIGRGVAVPEKDLPGFERRARARPDPAYERRLEQLKVWRTPTAARYSLPPGLIAPNGTLEGVARAVPTTIDELLSVTGVRAWQAEEFGAEILAVLGAANRSS